MGRLTKKNSKNSTSQNQSDRKKSESWEHMLSLNKIEDESDFDLNINAADIFQSIKNSKSGISTFQSIKTPNSGMFSLQSIKTPNSGISTFDKNSNIIDNMRNSKIKNT